jgi:hypothetical protein
MFGKTISTEITRLNRQVEDLQSELKKRGEWFDDLKRTHAREKEEWEYEKKKLVDAESILKKKFEEERALAFKTMELEFKGKMQEEVNRVRNEATDKVNKGIEENFAKLKDSLAKLHEEGNAQTKFTEQIALKMMETMKPAPKAIEEK